jgi:hypothetical protein
MKLSAIGEGAHGEDAKFCLATSSQIKRHTRRRVKKLGAVGEYAE